MGLVRHAGELLYGFGIMLLVLGVGLQIVAQHDKLLKDRNGRQSVLLGPENCLKFENVEQARRLFCKDHARLHE